MHKEGLKVLVLDGSTFRTNALKLEGGDFSLRIVHTFSEGQAALLSPWDLVLVSGFLGDWNNPFPLEEELKASWLRKTLRGVVVYNPEKEKGRAFTSRLKAGGVPCTFIPYDFRNPSKHVKEEVKRA